MSRRVSAALAATLLAVGCGDTDRGSPAASMLAVEGREPRACGVADVSALTAEPGAEKADTPEAAALRKVTREGIAGMSFPPKDDWILLSRSDSEVTFGHREGDVGVGAVVTVRRAGSEWTFAGSGGCGPLGYSDGRTAANIHTYQERPGQLRLSWTGGDCDDGSEPHVAVRQSGDVISVLLVPPARDDADCSDVGTSETMSVPIDAPVGGRRVVNVGYLPVREIPSEEQYAADQQAEADAYLEAEGLCNSAAVELGAAVAAAVYPTDVATVRRHVPEAEAAWGGIPGDTAAGHCYLEQDDGKTWSYVVSESAPTIAFDKDYDRGYTYFRLGD